MGDPMLRILETDEAEWSAPLCDMDIWETQCYQYFDTMIRSATDLLLWRRRAAFRAACLRGGSKEREVLRREAGGTRPAEGEGGVTKPGREEGLAGGNRKRGGRCHEARLVERGVSRGQEIGRGGCHEPRGEGSFSPVGRGRTVRAGSSSRAWRRPPRPLSCLPSWPTPA